MADVSAQTQERFADKRGIRSWMLYDWAAQPFHTLILTFIFAPYFTSQVAATPEQGQEYWGYAVAAGGFIVAILAPIFGTFVDDSGPRKPWIAFFSIFFVLGSASLYLATPNGSAPIVLMLIAICITFIGTEMTTIFNNSMMPLLVPRSELGKLSGSAWGLGYAGGLVSLAIILTLFSADPESGTTLIGIAPVFGLDAQTYAGDRATGPFTAIWYLIFVIPLFLFTPDAPKTSKKPDIASGLRELWQTIKQLPQRTSYFRFLISSLLYRDGLNALYAFGGIYAAGVLQMSTIQIGIFGILAALAGAIGAFFGGRMDARFGPKRVSFVSCWLLVLASLLVVATTQTHTLFVVPVSGSTPLIIFYVAGAILGAAGGSLQAASRTLLVDQVGADETTQAFGLYALAGKSTSFMGPLLIALVTAMTQSQRLGITPVIVLLAIGAIGLLFVSEKKPNAA